MKVIDDPKSVTGLSRRWYVNQDQGGEGGRDIYLD